MKLTQIRNLTIAAVLLLGLFGCDAASPPPDTGPAVTETMAYAESTAPPETAEPMTEATEPTESADSTEPTQGKPKEQESKPPTQTSATEPTQPTATQPAKPTEPAQTEPPTEATEPEPYEITADFKRLVAQYARQYINQYRREAGVSACTYLPGMTLVAEFRADQLTYNFSHSTADKREALAYYQYGRYVDATLAGLPESESYYEADSAEAICAGFRGMDAEALGKAIAKLIRNSGSHWSCIGSSEYSYIGVGVEYREGSEYGWYACVMVGSVNYG